MRQVPPPGAPEDGTGGTGEATSSAYGAVGVPATASDAKAWIKKTAAWLESSDDTDPALLMAWCCECEEDFRPRRIKAPLVLAWLVLQVLGALYQFAMLWEIWQHLVDFEGTLATYCGPEHRQQDVCLGPAWNLSYTGVLEFPPMESLDEPDFDVVIPPDRSFSFETRSSPATFLAGIEPLRPHEGARWRLALAENGAPRKNDGGPIWGTGKRYTVVTSKPMPSRGAGARRWTGSLTLQSKYAESTSVHVYVVDSRIQHLEEIHKQEQCSFEESWKNFSERDSGRHHQVLLYTWRATAFFLLVSLTAIGVMLRRFLYFVEGGKLLSRLIVAKFLLQDLPQQLCIAAYLYGWYAQNGLRCQMCLFHPQHCDSQHPLHWSNSMLCLFTLLSACANQLLLQVRVRQYDEEEECFQCCVRFALISVSTLPFSTAALLLSGPLLQLRSPLVYILVGIPAVVGWGGIFCMPMTAACDE